MALSAFTPKLSRWIRRTAFGLCVVFIVTSHARAQGESSTATPLDVVNAVYSWHFTHNQQTDRPDLVTKRAWFEASLYERLCNVTDGNGQSLRQQFGFDYLTGERKKAVSFQA